MPNLHHTDPRMGDEDAVPDRPHTETHVTGSRKGVKLQIPSTNSNTAASSDHSEDGTAEKSTEKKEAQKPNPVMAKLLDELQWIPANLTWAKFKPVIRSSIVAFVSVILLVISRVEHTVGTASFLILIAAALDPPAGSFIEVVEREVIMVLFVCIGWAWNCLGIYLASLARSNIDYNPTQELIITGRYLEAGPTVIIAVFIFIGCFFFLYLKARLGPGPFTVATVFGAISVDIPMLSAALYPYPDYNIGKVITIPLAIHAGLAILCSAIIFPTTMTAQYTAACNAVLAPLDQILLLYRQVLKMDPASSEFASTATTIHGLVDKADAGLAGTSATYRLLKRDILWGRFSPSDIGSLQDLLRPLVVRTNGLGTYFYLIDPTREKFPMTPMPSMPATPTSRSRTPTRSSSPLEEAPDGISETLKRRRRLADHSPSPLRQSFAREVSDRLALREKEGSLRSKDTNDHDHDRRRSTWSRHFRHHRKQSGAHHTHHDNHLHFSLLTLAHTLSSHHHPTLPSEPVVGVFESQRYMALEATRLGHGSSPETTALFVGLVQESCDELLEHSQKSLKAAQEWISKARSGTFASQARIQRERKARLGNLEKVTAGLKDALERFRKDKRLRVLDPYRSAFDTRHIGSHTGTDPPPHKFLFHCYVYQYHLMRFSMFLIEMLDVIINLEKERTKGRFWMPTIPLRQFVTSDNLEENAATHQNDDEDPDILQGLDEQHGVAGDLGIADRRDPDALPPDNVFQLAMNIVYRASHELFNGNSLFALKAAILTIVLSIPSLLKSSAAFAFGERFVWAVFMAQLTLARWRGDTTFGLVSRILATIGGCVVGLVLWYISTGLGKGNAFGLAATIGVACPFIFFGRLYWPGPPMTNIIFFVTIMLIVGYSWQNTHMPIGFNYWGWELAWRRFLLVSVGVTAAFIFSFLPPSTTLRGYQRRMMATTVAELGGVYCSIVSYANSREHMEPERLQILQRLLAIRLKLNRSHVMKANITYEFSLRGRWPAERYKKILDNQVRIAFLLSHLMSIIQKLEPAWTRAFLKRTRLLDSDFQGDILAVISLISTSLRTGQPLPQITPCPLLDRFMVHTHGLNVIRQEADDDYGLPRTMTIDTLENEQYMYFSVGVTTAFGIIVRLDKLMVATKELVGEQYHIHGVGMSDYRPARDV
ncbi:hypothetical protein BXZ70DRAFT_909843 [Cristinia sonorae]|uniref:ER transporter 6TM N-terminal domain-containing protein n=1 Tax=Cristinia sonorae TaxID=1940300 RepID=A0A8K0UHZ5_9AGAR|nr:hypothetical protein BXZ70DRAFT_909843 [Cristinia sonorae]